MFTALPERRVTLSFLLVAALLLAGATALFPLRAMAGKIFDGLPGSELSAHQTVSQGTLFLAASDRDPTLDRSMGKSFSEGNTSSGTRDSQTTRSDQSGTDGRSAGTQRDGANTAQKKNGAAPLQDRNGAAPVSKQFVGGSMVGAVFFGYPFEGLGIVDLLAFSVLIALGLKIFARTRGDRDRENTTSVPYDQNDYERDNSRDNTPARRNQWTQKNGQDKEDETPWGSNLPSPPQNPDTIQKRADNMWAHLRSAPPSRAPGSLTSGADVPEDFRVDDFLNGARTLYTRLQTSWASRDLDDLVPFTSPGMMQVIRDHAAHDPTPTTVEVLLVNASIANVKREGDEESAAVIFNALMRNGDEGDPTEARELWHFVRNRNTGGMWRLDGIEQVQQG